MGDALVLPRGRDESDDALQQLAAAELECCSPVRRGDPAMFPFFQHHHVIVGRALLGAADPAAWVSQQQALLEAIV